MDVNTNPCCYIATDSGQCPQWQLGLGPQHGPRGCLWCSYRDHVDIQGLCITGFAIHWMHHSGELAPSLSLVGSVPLPGSIVELVLVAAVAAVVAAACVYGCVCAHAGPKGMSVRELILPPACHGVTQVQR